jgi:hypothetical protein
VKLKIVYPLVYLSQIYGILFIIQFKFDTFKSSYTPAASSAVLLEDAISFNCDGLKQINQMLKNLEKTLKAYATKRK